MPARRRRTAPAVAVASALLVAAVGLRCIRRDELFCENAVAWLERCCPGFHPDQSYCSYGEGCGTIYPTITEDDSKCIVAMGCEQIAAANICDRAANAIPPTSGQAGTDLCP
jgi:hypothetical protein